MLSLSNDSIRRKKRCQATEYPKFIIKTKMLTSIIVCNKFY